MIPSKILGQNRAFFKKAHLKSIQGYPYFLGSKVSPVKIRTTPPPPRFLTDLGESVRKR